MPKYRVLKKGYHDGRVREVGDVFATNKTYDTDVVGLELVGKGTRTTDNTGAASLVGTSSKQVDVPEPVLVDGKVPAPAKKRVRNKPAPAKKRVIK